MDVKEFYRKLGEIRFFKSIEEQFGDIFRIIGYESFTASGIGVIPDTIPDNIRLQLSRRFRKKGKIIFFDEESLDVLQKYRDYVVFLVSKLYHGEREVEFEKYFEVLWAECRRNPLGLKLRFPQWKVIRGAVKIGRREFPLKGIVRIPTYDKYTVMFICHPEDTWREMPGERGGKRYVNLIDNIITKYRHGTRWGGKVITSNTSATPLFFS